MKLFHSWLSSASRRVRLCLAEKGMAYESVPVDLQSQEQHSPRYLEMNPNGMVPALQLGNGRCLHESATICEFLDDLQPEPPLRPADPYALAQMRSFVRWTDEHCLPHLLTLNWSLALQPVASAWSDAELADRLARIPTPEWRAAWQRIARQPYTAFEKAEALRLLLRLPERMEQLLSGPAWVPLWEPGPRWLAGGCYTLADIAAVPFIARLDELAGPILAQHPRVLEWWSAAQARPAFAAARIEPFHDALSRRATDVPRATGTA